MKEVLQLFKEEIDEELNNILKYWIDNTVDEVNGGFYGRIDVYNRVDASASKGSVLNSRILWTFSAAYNLKKNNAYLIIAERAFDYIKEHFIDKEQGGVYWSVDHKGRPMDTKKQIYALAFSIYGLSEYYKASKNEEAKELAIAIYHKIEQYSHDRIRGGYIEALTQDWKEIQDLRLSDKDANEKKTMNTHLHVLEAYTNLYRVWPDSKLLDNIVELVNLFLDKIIHKETNHLILFFDENWKPKSNIISFGHDIEAAWLIQEAAEVTGDQELLQKVKERSVQIARAAEKGLDKDGGLWYEYDNSENHWIKEKHWWPQSEAVVGYLNAWQITGDAHFLNCSINNWKFIKDHIIDKEQGEWFWGIKEDYAVMKNEDKVGLWKCPYHNGRACIEVVSRLSKVQVH